MKKILLGLVMACGIVGLVQASENIKNIPVVAKTGEKVTTNILTTMKNYVTKVPAVLSTGFEASKKFVAKGYTNYTPKFAQKSVSFVAGHPKIALTAAVLGGAGVYFRKPLMKYTKTGFKNAMFFFKGQDKKK